MIDVDSKIEKLFDDTRGYMTTLLKKKFAIWIFNNFADVSSKIIYISSSPSAVNIIKNIRKKLVFIPSSGYISEDKIEKIDDRYISSMKNYPNAIEFSSIANINDLIYKKI